MTAALALTNMLHSNDGLVVIIDLRGVSLTIIASATKHQRLAG